MTSLERLTYCAAATALFSLTGVGLWSWRGRVLTAETEITAKVRAASAKWAILSAQLKEADAARVKFTALAELEARFARDELAPKWGAALKFLVTSHGPETELNYIDARPRAESPDVCDLRISGITVGPSPRAAAERFRRALLDGLESLCRPAPATVTFVELEDLPAAPANGQERCSFTLAATFTQPKPAADKFTQALATID